MEDQINLLYLKLKKANKTTLTEAQMRKESSIDLTNLEQEQEREKREVEEKRLAL